MNILVCGARGFIGRTACDALRRHGHHVVEAASVATGPASIAVDFVRDDDPARWLPRLAGIDAVVNAVGVLRDSGHRPLAAVHEQVPRALFEACATTGVRRVVHVSALGIVGSSTAYARTKRAAEDALLAHVRAGRLDAVIVRPSIVFGRAGASSRFFLALSRLPALLLPQAVRATRVQPVAVAELADALARLVEAPLEPARPSATAPDATRLLAAVGPASLTLGEFIASLRAQAGRAPARVGTLPDALARWSACAGDALPMSPWCSATLALLATDNVADPAPFERALGRRATRFDALLAAEGT
jgi:uncharacterized protein YbjT (DUF2867 family)